MIFLWRARPVTPRLTRAMVVGLGCRVRERLRPVGEQLLLLALVGLGNGELVLVHAAHAGGLAGLVVALGQLGAHYFAGPGHREAPLGAGDRLHLGHGSITPPPAPVGARAVPAAWVP